MSEEILKILGHIATGLAGIFSVIGTVYIARYRRSVALKEEEKKESEKKLNEEKESIKEKFDTVFKRIDELRERRDMTQRQLDIMQGEHNALSCKGRGNGKRNRSKFS